MRLPKTLSGCRKYITVRPRSNHSAWKFHPSGGGGRALTDQIRGNLRRREVFVAHVHRIACTISGSCVGAAKSRYKRISGERFLVEVCDQTVLMLAARDLPEVLAIVPIDFTPCETAHLYSIVGKEPISIAIPETDPAPSPEPNHRLFRYAC